MKPRRVSEGSWPVRDKSREELIAEIESKYAFGEKHEHCCCQEHESEGRQASCEACQEARHHCWSVLAFCDSRPHALAIEYLDWRQQFRGATIREDLGTWEEQRFGARLYASAHGLLLHFVLWRAFPDDGRWKKLGPLPKVAPSGLAMPADPEKAIKKLGRAHEMPKARLGRKEHAERVYELQKQAAAAVTSSDFPNEEARDGAG